jgi:cold shock CspA family protein
MVTDIEARLSSTAKLLEGQRKDLAMLDFSCTEGSNDQELVVGQPITFDAETRANGSRTNQIRPL